jgi:hypothetical protein
MHPVIEDAIVVACEDEEKVPVPVIGEKFAESYESLARAVIDAREILTLGLYPVIMKAVIGKACSWLALACEHPSRRKRIPVDVQKTVDVWVPLIKKLAVAHDVDEKDAASSAMDEALLPIIAAPVAQVREFYKALTQRLKSNPEIPWAVWKLFEFWGDNVLDKISLEEVAGLKKEIATRIAERSEAAIPREEWVIAMVGALQWRSPEKLQEIEAALDAGQKPSIRGKESCLFLQVGEAEVML